MNESFLRASSTCWALGLAKTCSRESERESFSAEPRISRRRQRATHLSRDSSGKHTISYECSVCRLVSGASSAEQRDVALAGVAKVDCSVDEGELGVEVGETSKRSADERFVRVCDVLCRFETTRRAGRERCWLVTSGLRQSRMKRS